MPLDFSELFVEGDSEATIRNMESLLGDITTAGADAQGNLALAYEESVKALDTIKSSLDPEQYEAMKEALATGFEIDSAKIQEQQEFAIKQIEDGLQTSVTSMADNIQGSDWDKFWFGERTANARAQQSFVDSFDDIFEKIDLSQSTAATSQSAIDGFAEGLRSGDTSKVSANAKLLAENIPESIRSTLDIHSPSGVTEELGKYTVQGFANGIEQNTQLVKSPSNSLAKDSIDAMTKSIEDNTPEAVSAFKGMLNQMIGALNLFSNRVAESINGTVAGVSSSMNNLKLRNGSAAYSSMNAVKVPELANGGLVNAGQLFIANERGPELVGGFGNQTGVMNNEQIVDAVSQGVYEAVSVAMSQQDGNGQPIVINLDGRPIYETTVQQKQSYGYSGFQSTAIKMG